MADTRLAKVGITVKEPWASNISYEVLDMVLYDVADGGDGCSYVALKSNIGVTPGTDATTWLKSTQAGQSIYDLAVKYHHFVGTEAEFEQQYQDALVAANTAASDAEATNTAVQAAEALRVSAEQGRVSTEQSRVNAETARESAETARESAETARASAESARASAETARASAESERVTAESGRVAAESARESAESARAAEFGGLERDMTNAINTIDKTNDEVVEAEAARVTAEQGRVAAESARVSAESARATAEQGRATAEQGRVSAESSRVSAETARETQASSDHTRAGQDHTQAGNDHTTAAQDHGTAGSDHTQAGSDHTRAESDHSTAVADHEQAVSDHDAIAAKASTADLLDGTLVPALADNLEPWDAQDDLSTEDTWDDVIRTTAGSNPIETERGGTLVAIVPREDFSCAKLITTGYNQLRLIANGGQAFTLGSSFAFPVPKLTFGEYGSSQENNGILFTNSEHENLNPTVRFQPLASGKPTSENDGTLLSAQSNKDTANANGGIYTDHSLKFYLTSGPGWLIVSGITHADTCAHIAWEDWYDKFVSPTDADDSGDEVNLAPIFAAMPNGTGKALVLKDIHTSVAFGATAATITDPIARVASPSWTDTDNGDGTYTHSLTISAMKSGGRAAIEGSTQTLIASGTTVSYTDENATAISGAVRYEKATPATATVNISPDYELNDCGIEMLTEVVGSAYITTTYACNIADWLAEFAKHNDLMNNRVIAQAIAELYDKAEALRRIAFGAQESPKLRAKVIDAELYRNYGFPMAIEGAGAPSAAIVPKDWDKLCPGIVWLGIPLAPAMEYFDNVNNKWYKAKMTLTGAVSDWIALN